MFRNKTEQELSTASPFLGPELLQSNGDSTRDIGCVSDYPRLVRSNLFLGPGAILPPKFLQGLIK